MEESLITTSSKENSTVNKSGQQLPINYHQQGPKLMITWTTASSSFIDKQKSVMLWQKYFKSLQLDIGIAISDSHSHMVELLSTAPEALKQIWVYRTWTPVCHLMLLSPDPSYSMSCLLRSSFQEILTIEGMTQNSPSNMHATKNPYHQHFTSPLGCLIEFKVIMFHVKTCYTSVLWFPRDFPPHTA